MANRLSVIMVHTTPPTAAGHRLSERLVGELIGRPGLDLMLVGALDDLPPESTDRLTLESLAGDVVVLAWRSMSETMDDLSLLGFDGHRSPHAGDPVTPSAPMGRRKIFAVDLNRYGSADPVLDLLQGLLQSRGIKTFTIGSIGPGRPSGPTAVVNKSAPSDLARPTPTSSPVPESSPPPKANQSGEIDLDQLLDQLDASDE